MRVLWLQGLRGCSPALRASRRLVGLMERSGAVPAERPGHSVTVLALTWLFRSAKRGKQRIKRTRAAWGNGFLLGEPGALKNVSESGASCSRTDQRPREDDLERFGLVSAFAESFVSLQRSRNKNLSQCETCFFKKTVNMGSFENFHCYFPPSPQT